MVAAQANAKTCVLLRSESTKKGKGFLYYLCVFSAKNLANASWYSGCHLDSAGRFASMSWTFHSILAASTSHGQAFYGPHGVSFRTPTLKK